MPLVAKNHGLPERLSLQAGVAGRCLCWKVVLGGALCKGRVLRIPGVFREMMAG